MNIPKQDIPPFQHRPVTDYAMFNTLSISKRVSLVQVSKYIALTQFININSKTNLPVCYLKR